MKTTDQCCRQIAAALMFFLFLFFSAVCLSKRSRKYIRSCVQILDLFFAVFTGVYEVSCRVTDHYSAGMRQQYRVNLCQKSKVKHTHAQPTKIVQYFISAEEIEWDYSPERDWEVEKHHSSSEDRCVCVCV